MSVDTLKITFWKEKDYFIGYISEYPDYRTQALTIEELKENIIDIYNEIQSGNIENITKASFMEFSV